jgi:hypothetical protein
MVNDVAPVHMKIPRHVTKKVTFRVVAKKIYKVSTAFFPPLTPDHYQPFLYSTANLRNGRTTTQTCPPSR